MVINALRGHLAEYGVAALQGTVGVRAVRNTIECDEVELPDLAHLGDYVSRKHTSG